MQIKKVTHTNLELNATLKPISNLNVEFYDQDINTSLLRFKIKHCNKAIDLSLSEVESYIMLVAQDGSKIHDYLIGYDEKEGVVSYTIPTDFLKHAGRVLGQVYVHQNDNVLVTRTFSFVIKESLINEFSAKTKLEYIKTFDDLETIIKNKVIAIEEAISNGADYVTAMEKAAEKGQKDIQAVATKATADVNKAATDANKKITDTSNTAVATVNAKGDAVVKKITDADVVQKKDALFYTDGKGFSRPVPNGITDWYQISTAGNYSITKTAVPTNAPPVGVYFNLIVNTRTSTTRDLTAINISTGAIFTNAMTSVDAWSGWVKVATEKEAQMQKITADNGQFYYNLTDNKSDILASVISESGFKTGYAHFTVLNGLGNNRSFRFTSYYYPTNGYIHAIDTAGQSHIRVCNGGAWSAWKSIADTSVTQNAKITNDDGSTIVIANYDLLNSTDVSNFDGYSNTAINMPTGVSQAGYIKRKYRGGLIEVTYSPYNSNAVYRNSYNSVSGGSWLGWEKLVTASELAASKSVVLWSGSANGVSSTPYALSRAINTSRKIRVTYDFPGASGKTAVVDLSNTKIFIIHDLNLTDSDANGGGLYEFQLDFTALNKFTIKADTVKDLNGTGKIDQKNITVRKIEEAD